MDPIGGVDQDEQGTAEDHQGDLGTIPEAEGEHKEGEHGSRRKGAEKVDDKLHRVIDLLPIAEHNAQRHPNAHRDQISRHHAVEGL